MIRPRATALALALALTLAGAACSDDGGDKEGQDTTTTTAEGGATTSPDETTTTVPPVTGPADLQALLVDPAQIGEGFALDSLLGNGTFTGELCGEVTLEETWTDQASQAVTRGNGDTRELVTQAILDFADEGEAETFVQSVIDGNDTCLPGGEVQPVEAGDEGILIVIGSESVSSSAAVVRVGATVTALTSQYPTGTDNPLTTELLMTAGEALAG